MLVTETFNAMTTDCLFHLIPTPLMIYGFDNGVLKTTINDQQPYQRLTRCQPEEAELRGAWFNDIGTLTSSYVYYLLHFLFTEQGFII